MPTRLTLLQAHHPCEPILEVPQIHRAHTPLIVQLPIHIKRLIRRDLHLPDALPRLLGVRERGLELAGPRRPVGVAIAVVVAEEVVAAGGGAALEGEGLVDGGEQVFRQVGDEGAEGGEVRGCVLGGEAAEEVSGVDVSDGLHLLLRYMQCPARECLERPNR